LLRDPGPIFRHNQCHRIRLDWAMPLSDPARKLLRLLLERAPVSPEQAHQLFGGGPGAFEAALDQLWEYVDRTEKHWGITPEIWLEIKPSQRDRALADIEAN